MFSAAYYFSVILCDRSRVQSLSLGFGDHAKKAFISSGNHVLWSTPRIRKGALYFFILILQTDSWILIEIWTLPDGSNFKNYVFATTCSWNVFLLLNYSYTSYYFEHHILLPYWMTFNYKYLLFQLLKKIYCKHSSQNASNFQHIRCIQSPTQPKNAENKKIYDEVSKVVQCIQTW